MSDRVTILLECDVCKARRQGRTGETIVHLRERLAEVGWYSDGANDVDHCPSCPPPAGVSR